MGVQIMNVKKIAPLIIKFAFQKLENGLSD